MKQIPYWLDTAPALPDRSGKGLPDEADVVVIGGGLTGLSTAYHAARKGARVVLVEKGKVGSGASGRNGSHCSPRWRPREEDLATATARTEAVRLAKRILVLDAEITDNTNRIGELVDASPAAELVEETGIGPVTAATVLVAWSHPGRIRNEAAFAALAGVSPLPASSGNTTRHRLNRGGDNVSTAP
jgi:glycine/D-amino acid oxidase-like deaminating enzyme